MDTDTDFLEISNELLCHHSVFSMLWELGRPVMTDKIETAAVGFDKTGACIQFMFNPTFLKSLSKRDLCFVIAHECMHVILDHGRRLKGLYPEIGNIAADITINEMLISMFGFVISDNLKKTVCLRESVFPANKLRGIEANREFEYYYQEIMKDAKVVEYLISNGVGLLDDHSMLPDDVPKEIRDIIDQISKEEAESLAKNLHTGDGSSFEWVKAVLKPAPRQDWRQVIKNWTIKQFRQKHKTQWKTVDRRFTTIQRTMPKVVIPSVGYVDDKANEKIDMTFFMDVSGSCHGESQKFFAAAKTIPGDKFIISPYAFDTAIIPINIADDKLPMGGGTSFNQLEKHCLSLRQYPSAVFVLTDGYGNNVNPKYPERWHIFLTQDYRACFPETVNFYAFGDFHGVK